MCRNTHWLEVNVCSGLVLCRFGCIHAVIRYHGGIAAEVTEYCSLRISTQADMMMLHLCGRVIPPSKVAGYNRTNWRVHMHVH